MNIRAGSLAIAAAILLAACTDGGAGTPTGTTSVVIGASSTPPPSTPSTSVMTTPPTEAATARADEVVRAYYRAQSTCLANPDKVEVTCFDQVAIGTALADARNSLVSAKAMQTRTVGGIQVISAQTTKVDLANDVTKTPPIVPMVAVRTCIDVSNFNVVDKEGKSIVPPQRKPRSVGSVVVVNYKYPDPSRWRVAYIVPESGGTC